MSGAPLRRGMVLVSPGARVLCCRQFDAKLTLVHGDEFSDKNYCVVYVGGIRQTAQFKWIDKGAVGLLIASLTFLHQPEVIHQDSTIILRQGRSISIAHVLRVYALETETGSEQIEH
eukprot:c20399_g2_i2.p1 GENE.c20399_g2_i2~~c20399_g2_i2.p1  ORF type:complete len:117 (-),score=24.12 c20399_g2_i2:54-404(-)